MSIEAMRQAIDFAKYCLEEIDMSDMASNQAKRLIKKSHKAIAEAEKQEPVAWAQFSEIGNLIDLLEEPCKGYAPLYTHPQPKREWVELTPEEVLAHANDQLVPKFFAMGAAWANAKLKEKNT